MKKYLRRLFPCLCITLFLPYIPLAQEVEDGVLWLGFPYKFYAVYAQHDFAVHFGVGAFLLDVFIIYLIYAVTLAIIDKCKTTTRRRASDE